jgi:hypothetical protein
MSVISDLIDKRIDVENAALTAMKDNFVISELIEGIQSSNDPIRYNSFKVILLISEKHPKLLYPHWSLFEKMLISDNSYFKDIAIQIMANLGKVDTENRFEKIFDKYFGELHSEKTMVAAHVASNAGKIALAKPALQPLITNKLINIDTIYSGKQIDLIKSYVIEAFLVYYDTTDVKDKDRISEFIKKEVSNRSPRTRRAAAAFQKAKGIDN